MYKSGYWMVYRIYRRVMTHSTKAQRFALWEAIGDLAQSATILSDPCLSKRRMVRGPMGGDRTRVAPRERKPKA